MMQSIALTFNRAGDIQRLARADWWPWKGSAMNKVHGVLCIAFLALTLGACSSARDKAGESTETISGALTGPVTFTIPLPPRVPVQSLAAGANDTLLIDDRTVVRTPAGTPATIANLGAAQTNLGTDTQVGSVWSVGPVVLRDRAHVTGFIRSQGTVTVAPTATVNPGPTVQNTPFTPLDSISWTVKFPTPTGDVVLEPNTSRTLQPGSYGVLRVQPSARITLKAGTYFFQSVDFEPQAVVTLDDKTGPISIYVANSIIYRATVSDTANKPANILIGFAGTAPFSIESSFIGTLVAPAARVTVGSLSHRGAFFAKGLELLPGATLVAQAFTTLPGITVEPSGPVKVAEPVYFTVLGTPLGFAVPLTYQWSVSSTPPNLRFHLEQFGNTANFYGIDPGHFIVRLTITDPQGRRSVIDTPIEVLAAPPPDRPDRLDLNALTRPCRDGDETIDQFALRCDRAMGGVTVPAFDCEDPTSTEPPRQGTGSGSCEAPNVLNQECDPGSHFHVLHRNENNDGIYIVAHCRHQAAHGNAADQFGDVAVIQYNSNSGATCFYQALRTGLPRNAPAPSAGTGPGYWVSPQQTASINCVRCHDTGPLIRSPYLAQLGQVWPFLGDFTNVNNPNRPNVPNADSNYLPGTLQADLAGVWNRTLPYGFVGLNFQSWEAYSLTNTADSTCIGCHRMGTSRSVGVWNPGGTSQDLGLRATADTQASKVPHGKLNPGVTSPIWMTPGQFTVTDASKTHANSMNTCAQGVASGNPPAGCSATRFARGDTCPPPPVVVNGATSSDDPTTWKTSGKTPLGQPGGRIGFYFFTTVHGPFYQNSPWDPYMNAPPAVADPAWDPPTNAPSFRGTYLRIYSEPPGQWMLAWGLDATDIQNSSNNPPSPGVPGGVIDGVAFDQIDSVPNPGNCGSGYHVITDDTGTNAPLTTTIDTPPGGSAAILAGFIGNVSRGDISSIEGLFASSFLEVTDRGGSTVLTQDHINNPEAAVNQWFTGESWANGCANWQASAHYAAHGVESFDDVLLVPIADVPNTICYIDGIEGDWSRSQSNGQGGLSQPFAQIYIDPATGYRLKVSPAGATDPNGIGATATCLFLKK